MTDHSTEDRVAADLELQTEIARRSAARTDPWRWYCRLCGQAGRSADRTVRNAEAYGHVGSDGPHAKPTVAADEAGRLLHVWCF